MRSFRQDEEPSPPPQQMSAEDRGGRGNKNDNDGVDGNIDNYDTDTDTSLPEAVAAARSSKRARKPSTKGGRGRKEGEPKSKKSKSGGKKKKKDKKEMDPEEEFETVWICSECKEAECFINPSAHMLLICEGPCRRLFHYPCVGLLELPGEEEAWFCPDCSSNKHRCSMCQEYGEDNVDVFLCSRKSCGLFFHEACLAMQNVEVVTAAAAQQANASKHMGSAKDDRSDVGTDNASASTTLNFSCPAHYCW